MILLGTLLRASLDVPYGMSYIVMGFIVLTHEEHVLNI